MAFHTTVQTQDVEYYFVTGENKFRKEAQKQSV